MSYAIEEAEYKTQLPSENPQMLLRVGCVKKYGENNAVRRDLSDYIKVH